MKIDWILLFSIQNHLCKGEYITRWNITSLAFNSISVEWQAATQSDTIAQALITLPIQLKTVGKVMCCVVILVLYESIRTHIDPQ